MNTHFALAVAWAVMVTAPMDRAAAQTSSPPAASEEAKAPLSLSEEERSAVIKAVIEAQSHQKTPKDFTPALGASVPKSVYQHGFKPEIARAMPILKHYWYAYLDREIVLIDASQKKVVAVIPLPAKLVSGGQEHHGAAEPDGEKSKEGTSNTGSVPAYTSPESLR